MALPSIQLVSYLSSSTQVFRLARLSESRDGLWDEEMRADVAWLTEISQPCSPRYYSCNRHPSVQHMVLSLLRLIDRRLGYAETILGVAVLYEISTFEITPDLGDSVSDLIPAHRVALLVEMLDGRSSFADLTPSGDGHVWRLPIVTVSLVVSLWTGPRNAQTTPRGTLTSTRFKCALCELGGVEKFIAMLDVPFPRVVYVAAAALSTLAKFSFAIQDKICKLEGISKIIQLIASRKWVAPNNTGLKAWLADALQNLLANNPANKEAARLEGGVEVLMAPIIQAMCDARRCGSISKLAKSSLSTLVVLSRDSACRSHIVARDIGTVALFIHLIHGDATNANNAMTILENCLKDDRSPEPSRSVLLASASIGKFELLCEFKPLQLLLQSKIQHQVDQLLSSPEDTPSYSSTLCVLLHIAQHLHVDQEKMSTWNIKRSMIRMGINDLPLPVDFFCPIMWTVMKDPVVASDGHTYEREAIQKVLNSGGPSPMTREKLHNSFFPNRALLNQIMSHEKWMVDVATHAVDMAETRDVTDQPVSVKRARHV